MKRLLLATATALLVSATPAAAQESFGPWTVTCDPTPTCSASQPLAGDESAIVIRAARLGITFDVLLGENRGSPRSITFYQATQPIGTVAREDIRFVSRSGGLRRFRLDDLTVVDGVLRALIDERSLGIGFEYATDTLETLTFSSDGIFEVIAELRSHVPLSVDR